MLRCNSTADVQVKYKYFIWTWSNLIKLHVSMFMVWFSFRWEDLNSNEGCWKARIHQCERRHGVTAAPSDHGYVNPRLPFRLVQPLSTDIDERIWQAKQWWIRRGGSIPVQLVRSVKTWQTKVPLQGAGDNTEKKITYFPLSSGCELLELFHVDGGFLPAQRLLGVFWLISETGNVWYKTQLLNWS